MKNELWKDIPNYEGLYQISNYGRIKSLKRQGTKGKIITSFEGKDGYLMIHLIQNGKNKTFAIHRLVGMAFINKYSYKSTFNEDRSLINLDDLVINHKDEDKTNNNAENLEWCTVKYNNTYGTKIERISKKVKCIETGIIYNSSREAERQTGIYHNQISKCCLKRKKFNTAGGYHWCYA